ncbi:MAG: fibronectin type III domain-containing protein [Deltaproteobacteria bacterium]|nr:fibronectin type III domain-containing protein [Deltaproteobacteria bacterium]
MSLRQNHAALRIITLLCGLSACERAVDGVGEADRVVVGGGAEAGAQALDTGAAAALADDEADDAAPPLGEGAGDERWGDTGEAVRPAGALDLIEALAPVRAQLRAGGAAGVQLEGELPRRLAAQLSWCGGPEGGRALLVGAEGEALLAALLAEAGPGGGLHRLDERPLTEEEAERCAPAVAGGAVGGARPAASTSGDTTAPVGVSVVINGGDATTRASRVSLALSATDDTAVTQMCVSQSSSCSSWVSYASTGATSLSGAAGPRTVYVRFRDAAGNVSDPVTDTIIYDATRPTDGTLTATAGSGEVEFSWSGFADPGTGIAEYVLRRATGTTPPSSCTAGTEAWRGTGASTTVTGLTDGTTYAWRLCAIDGAGNISAGATVTARPASEYDAPTDASIELNGGAAWTNSASLTVTTAATDPSGVSHICLSEAASCTSWVANRPTVRAAIRRSNGTHTVNAWYRDTMGNVTAAPVSDSIGLDLTKPVNGTLGITTSAGTAQITATGFTDALSGVASYKLMQATGIRAPSSCTGRAVMTSADGDFTRTGLVDGLTYSWRVCAVDAAGNISSGKVVSGRPAPEYNAPTGGSVEIAGGAAAVKGARVTLTLSAEDDTRVSHVCLTNSTTCTAWTTYATTKTWTLSGGTGNRTVRAFFKDVYNNVTTAAVSDTVLQDQTRPVNGTAEASTASGSEIDVQWAGFSDVHTDVASYIVTYAAGLRAPASCTAGRVGFSGPGEQATVSGLRPGQAYSLRVCAVDTVGNISAGVTLLASTADNAEGPAGAGLLINEGELYTADSVLDLTLDAEDADGVAEMCISNDPDLCEDWVAYDTAATWEVPEGEDGPLTLYAWFRDGIGNVSEAPLEAEITVDRAAPLDGELSLAQSDDTTLTADWSGFLDETTGLASYVVVYTVGEVAPDSCTEGEELYRGADTSAALAELALGTTVNVRVCALDLAGNLSPGVLETRMTIDATAPIDGLVSLDGGAEFTGSLEVSVESSATDTAGVAEVCFSEAESCSDWQPYEPSLPFSIEAGDGVHTVNVWFRDSYGNESLAPASDSLQLDQTVPEDATLVEDGVTGTTVDLSWSGAFDTGSGLAGYRIAYNAGTEAPEDCASGEYSWEGVEDLTTLTDLTPGQRYALRLCAVDAVGNVSVGDTLVVRPLPEFDGPVGSITINAGAGWTNTASVSVTADATDETGVAQVCVSDSPDSCTAWEAYPGPVSATLAGISGEQTLYAWFEDTWGNRSLTPVSDSIQVETVLPVDGDATGVATSDRTAHFEWSDYSDADSGVASYRAVYALSTPPSSCSTGTLGYSGADSAADITGLLGGQVYGVRVCAIDAAGNMSAGTTFLVSTADTTAPAGGSLSINAGAIGTKTTASTLTISATDDSGVTQMCVSNTTSCTSWVTYATTKTHTLSSGAGTKTVYVKFRDRYGNTSANVTDTIIYETTAPTVSTLSGTAAVGGVSNLSWTASTDASSGLAGYKLVVREGTSSPASGCTSGTVLYNGPDRVFEHTGQVAGRKYTYRLCAYDNAGNTTTGTTKQLTGLL